MLQGDLFSRDFLEEGIRETAQWRSLSAADVEAFRRRAVEIFASFPTTGNPNEAQTEQDLIFKVFDALG